jgi:hypothetical protein
MADGKARGQARCYRDLGCLPRYAADLDAVAAELAADERAVGAGQGFRMGQRYETEAL